MPTLTSRPSADPWNTPAAAFACLCLLGITLLLGPQLADDSRQTQAIWSLMSVAFAYIAVLVTSVRGFWSMPALFMLVAILFHCGLLVAQAYGAEPHFFNPSDSSWFTSEASASAIVLVTIGLVSFSTGSVLAGLMRTRHAYRPNEVDEARTDMASTMGMLGCAVLSVSVTVWFFYTVKSLGLGFALSSYSVYLDATAQTPVYLSFYGIGYGLVLAAASGDPSWVKRSMFVFTIFAMAALPIGLRGEVLFPAAAAAALLARWCSMPRKSLVVILAFVLLTSISVIKQIRQVGLGAVETTQLTASPTWALAEMGATLRPVAVTVEWHIYNGEPFRDGDSYWAPLDRATSHLLRQEVPNANSDYRLMNVEIRSRVTGIGGSFIAEAYHNFGRAGVLLVPAFYGAILARLNSRRRTIVRDACAGMLLFALVQHIRNSFAPVPMQITFGLFLVGFVAIASMLRSRALDDRSLVVASGKVPAVSDSPSWGEAGRPGGRAPS